MKYNQTELSYRKAAIQNASAVGLVVILYDMLIDDLRSVIEAIERSDVEKRATDLKHGFLVLQQLEGALDMEKGGEAARNLSRFYSAMRAKLLEAHFKGSTEIFRRQIELLLDVRGAWQQVDVPATPSTASVGTSESQAATGASSNRESAGTGWSA
jgi:flagellar protein FliS